MNPNTKTILKWLGFIILVGVIWLIGSYAYSQPLTFDSKAALQSATYSAGVLTIKVTLPATEAVMIQKVLKKELAQEAVTQIGQNTADDVKRFSERMFHKQRDDARDFIPQSAIDAAIEAREVYEKYIADSVAAAQPVGYIGGDKNVAPAGSPLFYDEGKPVYAGIGKSISNRLDFLGAPEVAPDGFPIHSNNAVLILPTWEQAAPYIIVGGIVISLLVIFG